MGFKGAVLVLAGLGFRGAWLVVVTLRATRVGDKRVFTLAFFSCGWTVMLCTGFEMERVGTVRGGLVESRDEET